MTFPLDPGLRTFLDQEADLLPEKPAPLAPPEGFQAEDAEHVVVTPHPADDGAPRPS
jgi:hypothetical protein